MACHAVRCMYGETGFACSSFSYDQYEWHCELHLILARVDQVLVDLVDLLRPAGEIRDVGREQAWNLPFHRLHPKGRGRQPKSRIGGQNGMLELLQPLARLNSQLIDHGA